MKPMPKGGQVYFCRSMNTIKRVEAHPVYGWVYALQSADKSQGLMMHHNVSHAQLIAGIQEKAGYEPGQVLTVGRYGKKQVAHRKWNFEEGQAYYTVADPRTKKVSGWLSEARLNELVNWSEPPAAAPTTHEGVDREYEDVP